MNQWEAKTTVGFTVLLHRRGLMELGFHGVVRVPRRGVSVGRLWMLLLLPMSLSVICMNRSEIIARILHGHEESYCQQEAIIVVDAATWISLNREWYFFLSISSTRLDRCMGTSCAWGLPVRKYNHCSCFQCCSCSPRISLNREWHGLYTPHYLCMYHQHDQICRRNDTPWPWGLRAPLASNKL